jgi:hypothetical protein
VQNINEILSHHLPYVARSDKAAEINDPYGAGDTEAAEENPLCSQSVAPLLKNKKGLKEAYKRLEAEEAGKYEAKGEEAAEMRT